MNRTQQIQATIFGLLFILLGAYFLRDEMQGPVVHSQHVYIFAALMVVGAGIVFPAFILGFVQKIAVIIPWSGKFGNRPEDVPIQHAPAGTQPGDPVPGATPGAVAIATPPAATDVKKPNTDWVDIP